MPWVFRRQVRQDLLVDRVLAECRLLLPEAKALQPIPDVHDGSAAGRIGRYLRVRVVLIRGRGADARFNFF